MAGNRESVFDIEALRLGAALSSIEKCSSWLKKNDRLREEGIFRISGSVAKIKNLVERLCDEAAGGDVEVDLDQETVHTVAGSFKRILIDLEPTLLPQETCEALIESQNEVQELSTKISKFKTQLGSLPPQRLAILRHVFEFLRCVVAQQAYNKMGASNVCKVFAASVLRHPDNLKSALYLASGRLPAMALMLLLTDAILDSSFHSEEFRPCRGDELETVVALEEQKLVGNESPKHADLRPQEDWHDVGQEIQSEAAKGGSNSHGNPSAPPTSPWGKGWFQPWPLKADGDQNGFSFPWDDKSKQRNSARGAGADEDDNWLEKVTSWLPLKGGVLGLQMPWEDEQEEGRKHDIPSEVKKTRPIDKEDEDYVSIQNQGEYV